LEDLLIQVNPTANNKASVDTLEEPEQGNDDDIIQQTHKTQAYLEIQQFNCLLNLFTLVFLFLHRLPALTSMLLKIFTWSVNSFFNADDEHSQLYRMNEL